MKLVPTVIATSYQKSLITGRTTPGVFSCEDAKGNPVGEYVVKLRNNLYTGNAGLLRELVGSLLAEKLGIAVPEPAIVEIGPELTQAVSDQKMALSIRNSIGYNFGSKNLAGGYYTWPNDKTIPPVLKQAATDIFVYDALIQNPDRRRGRPNILWKGDTLIVIDHEMAFSFLLAIPAIKRSWDLNEQLNLNNHIFFNGLRHTKLDLERMMVSIEGLTIKFWEEMNEAVPVEWKGTELQRINIHIESVRQHLGDFMIEIRRVLQ